MDNSTQLDNSLTRSLEEIVNDLKVDANHAWTMKRSSRADFRRHIAAIYLAYRTAATNSDALKKAYSDAGLKVKRVSDTNYRPFLRLIWGEQAYASDRDLHIYSKAMNKIHAEVTANPHQFADDPITAIADFIEESHGLVALAGYGPKSSEVGPDDDEADDSSSAPDDGVTEAMRATGFLKVVSGFLSDARGEDFAPISTDAKVAAELGTKTGLLLVRVVDESLQVLGVSTDANAVTEVATKRYRDSFLPVAPKLRVVLETLRTQCLTGPLYDKQRTLVDKVTNSNGETIPAVRRLMYLGGQRQLLLSPTSAKSGVVTIATIKGDALMPGDSDYVMVTTDRHAIEQELLANNSHNLYALNTVKLQTDDGIITGYSLILDHVLGAAMMSPSMRFLANEVSQPTLPEQLSLGCDIDESLWSTTWRTSQLRKLKDSVTDPWFSHCGRYLSRKQQLVLRLTFADSAVGFDFIRRDGGWEQHVDLACEADNSDSSAKLQKGFFLAKDLMPILCALGSMDVEGDVAFKLHGAFASFQFSTAVADYIVAVPLTDDSGDRECDWCAPYVPKQYVSFETAHGIADSGADGEEF